MRNEREKEKKLAGILVYWKSVTKFQNALTRCGVRERRKTKCSKKHDRQQIESSDATAYEPIHMENAQSLCIDRKLQWLTFPRLSRTRRTRCVVGTVWPSNVCSSQFFVIYTWIWNLCDWLTNCVSCIRCLAPLHARIHAPRFMCCVSRFVLFRGRARVECRATNLSLFFFRLRLRHRCARLTVDWNREHLSCVRCVSFRRVACAIFKCGVFHFAAFFLCQIIATALVYSVFNINKLFIHIVKAKSVFHAVFALSPSFSAGFVRRRFSVSCCFTAFVCDTCRWWFFGQG